MKNNEQTLIVENGRLVLPDRIEDGASMRVEDGVIVEIGRMRPAGGERRIDASGCVVLPGIIDLHSDAL
jgi:dihydropyrimidinase